MKPVDSQEQTPLSEQLFDRLLISSETFTVAAPDTSAPALRPITLQSAPVVPVDDEVKSEEPGEHVTRCNCGLPD